MFVREVYLRISEGGKVLLLLIHQKFLFGFWIRRSYFLRIPLSIFSISVSFTFSAYPDYRNCLTGGLKLFYFRLTASYTFINFFQLSRPMFNRYSGFRVTSIPLQTLMLRGTWLNFNSHLRFG
jgi:hypothetical protein